MPTLIKERSTYWVRSGGSSPLTNQEDYRAYWKIYYDTDTANNRTLITVDYYLQSTHGLIWGYGTATANCTVNGNSLGSVTISYPNGTELSNGLHFRGTKTIYVNHNADGSASFTWQGTGAGKSTSTATYSTANGDFPAIPQGTSVSQSIASKSDSAIIVNWSSGDTVDYIWYSIDGGNNYIDVGSVSGTSGSYTISNLSPSTTYSIVTRARRQSSQVSTNYSNSNTVTTNNPPYISSITDVTETSFKINYSVEYNTDYAWYSLDDGSTWSDLPINNIINASPNTSYQVKVKLRHTESQTTYQNGSNMVPVTTRDYPKVTSMNNFTIGDGASVYLYNPLGRNVTLQILQHNTNTLLGSYTGTYEGVVNAEFATSDAIDKQYRSIQDKPSGTYYCRVIYSNISTKDYDDAQNHTYYAKESDCKPDISASYFDYEDSNDDATTGTVRLTGDNSIFILGYSTLHLELNTSLSGKNYASISKIFVNNVEYAYSNSFDLELENYSSSVVTINVVDTRGFASETITIPLNTKDYSNIIKSINYDYSRSNQGVGNEVTFIFSGEFWNNNFGNVQNELSADYTIYNQKTGVTTTGTSPINITTNNNDFSFNNILYGDTNNGFDIDSKYTVTINVKDLLSATQYVIQVIEGTPAIALYGNKISLGAKYDTNLGGDVQINGEIYINRERYRGSLTIDDIYPIGSIYMSINSNNPSTLFGGTWEQIKDKFLLACGNTYPNGSTGGNAKHSHNLSTNGWANIVMHNSGFVCYNERTTSDWTANYSVRASREDSQHSTESYGATLGGTTEETTILPPYLAVYVWKRIA